MSISAIRAELKQEGDFTSEEISEICKSVSDFELEQLNAKDNDGVGFFGSVYFAYLLVLAFLILSIYAVFSIQDLSNQLVDRKIDTGMKMWRYFLLAGSLFFLVRNVFRVMAHFKRSR
jgi:hypothetical protein